MEQIKNLRCLSTLSLDLDLLRSEKKGKGNFHCVIDSFL